MSPAAQQAFDRIVALQELTITSKVQTYKSQSEILKSLNPTDLADVAVKLQARNALLRSLSGQGR